jgi:nitrate reductase gamma subunit
MSRFMHHAENALKTRALVALAILSIWILMPGNVMAMAVPAAGSFAYDLYDIGVNQILLGPIGFIAGVACMVFAAILAIRQMILPAAGVVLGGAFLLRADSVVQTIGALIG